MSAEPANEAATSRPRVGMVIPAVDEEEALPHVLAELPAGLVDRLVVADNGSRDHTPEVARAGGAEVVPLDAGRPLVVGRADPADVVVEDHSLSRQHARFSVTDGVIKVEMHFLPDVYVPCDQCKGKRYNRETLEITYKGRTISDVLDMTVEEARQFFDAVPAVAGKLKTLTEVGLSYVHIGQNATTLSGGEAQRVKLARELSKRDTGKTLYILDEPTTGLHFYDIEQLLKVLHRLRDHGNTVIVIEHNLDVIKTADWIVDLGPEGGSGGGEVVASGTPEDVAASERSHTGRFLKQVLARDDDAAARRSA